jgi:hypothetical protein
MNFVNPLFFIGALAAGVPILLHLIKRERAQRVEFPTLMFLRKISRKTIRYQKLRHLLLLLLRVLALLLIVAAFMRPFRVMPTTAANTGRITRAMVILLDDSLSMGYGDRWARARKAASDIVRGAQSGDSAALLVFSDRTQARSQLTGDFGSVQAQIDAETAPSDHPTRYAQALRAAEQIVLNGSAGKRVIYLISDFQKTGWAADEQDFRLGSGIDLEHADVGSDDFSNLAFGDVQVLESDPNAGGGLKLKGTVIDYGTEDRQNVRVSLSLDGRVVTDQRVNVAKGAASGFEFSLPGLSPGSHPIVLEVEDSRLARDNRFSMIVDARDRTPVWCVETPRAGREQQPSSYFLSRALNVASLSPFQLSAVAPQAVASAATIAARVLIWNDAQGGNAGLQKKIRDYVSSGGGLVVVLSDASAADDFNRSFGTWLPVKAGEQGQTGRVRRDDYVLLTNVRLDHPVFQPFSQPHSGSFSTARFYRHVHVDLGEKAEALARFDNGDPAVVSATVDKGRVLVFTSSCDDSANDLPLKAVYVPLWQQMVRYVENSQEGRRWVEVGDTVFPRRVLVEAALKQAKGNIDLSQPIAVVDPSRERIPLSPGAEAFVLDKAGLYEIRALGLTATVAANPVARESDLTHGNPEEMLAGWQALDKTAKPAAVEAERLTPEQQDARTRIWRVLLLAGLTLLIGEALLANRSTLRSEP